MTSEIDLLYTEEWYRQHLPFRGEFHAMADIILGLDPEEQWRTCLDVGCGPGFILERLEERMAVWGVDGSAAATAHMPPEIRKRFSVVDLTQPMATVPYPGQFDLGICTEVAEHLRPEHAETLVSYLDTAIRKAIFWSAATPGAAEHMRKGIDQ